MHDVRVPITLVTGYLGSGKTTLLNGLLRSPQFADSVVIINEYGEAPLDHLLVEHISENIRLLDTGCLCCTVRGDLVDTLADLATRRRQGSLRFTRAFVETTGLADPVPLLHSVAIDPAVMKDWRLAGVATTLDAVNGAATLAKHHDAKRQLAVADLVVITKLDLSEADRIEEVTRRITLLNPHAAVCSVQAEDLLQQARDLDCTPPRLDLDRLSSLAGGRHLHPDQRIGTQTLTLETPIREAEFLEWLHMLAAMRGENLLRVKGLVAVAEDPDRPRLVQVVQHVVHPVAVLSEWPSSDRSTRIVFIVQDIDVDVIERTFRRYVGSTSGLHSQTAEPAGQSVAGR